MPQEIYNPNMHHRRSIRLKGYDYSSEGLYFITICTQDRQCMFGYIDSGEMYLNALGEMVYDEWLNTMNIRKDEVVLHEFVVMPNHIHAIIEICAGDGRGVLHTPSIANGTGVSHMLPSLHIPNPEKAYAIRPYGRLHGRWGLLFEDLKGPSPKRRANIFGNAIISNTSFVLANHTNLLPNTSYPILHDGTSTDFTIYEYLHHYSRL